GNYLMTSCSGSNCGAYIQCTDGNAGTDLQWKTGDGQAGERYGKFNCGVDSKVKPPYQISYRFSSYYNPLNVGLLDWNTSPDFLDVSSLPYWQRMLADLSGTWGHGGPFVIGAYLQQGPTAFLDTGVGPRAAKSLAACYRLLSQARTYCVLP